VAWFGLPTTLPAPFRPGAVPCPAVYSFEGGKYLILQIEEHRIAAHGAKAGTGQWDIDHGAKPTGAGCENRDLVTQIHRFGNTVGNEKHRDVGIFPHPEQLIVHLVAGNLIEGAERFIHQQNRRFLNERSGDRNPLSLTTGHVGRQSFRHIAQPDYGEEFVRSGAGGGVAFARQLQR
jgi:hypothetical protein